MPRIKRKIEPFLEHRETQHGKWVWYFRRDRDAGTPRIRLPDLYGSPEWRAAYQAALAGQPLPQPRQASKRKIKGLVDLYLKSPAWARLSPATRKARNIVLGKLVAVSAGDDVEDINKQTIAEEMARATPDMANLLLNTLRTMFAWAVDAGHVESNPAAAVKYLKKAKSENPDEEEGHKTWTEEDCSRFEATYPIGTLERFAYSVFLYTGLRVGDACRVGYQHVNKQDGVIQRLVL